MIPTLKGHSETDMQSTTQCETCFKQRWSQELTNGFTLLLILVCDVSRVPSQLHGEEEGRQKKPILKSQPQKVLHHTLKNKFLYF